MLATCRGFSHSLGQERTPTTIFCRVGFMPTIAAYPLAEIKIKLGRRDDPVDRYHLGAVVVGKKPTLRPYLLLYLSERL